MPNYPVDYGLENRVRACADGAYTEREFVDALYRNGIDYRARWNDAGTRVIGYVVRSHPNTSWQRAEALAPDLSLPSLRQSWDTSPGMERDAQEAWTRPDYATAEPTEPDVTRRPERPATNNGGSGGGTALAALAIVAVVALLGFVIYAMGGNNSDEKNPAPSSSTSESSTPSSSSSESSSESSSQEPSTSSSQEPSTKTETETKTETQTPSSSSSQTPSSTSSSESSTPSSSSSESSSESSAG